MPTKRNVSVIILAVSLAVFLFFQGYFLFTGALLAIVAAWLVLKKLIPENPTAPTAGAPSTKKKWTEYLRNPLKSKFAPIIIAVIAGLWFFSYQGQDTVKKGVFVAKGKLSSAISYTFEPKDLKETEVTIPGLVEGDYYIDVFSRKNIYTVKCPWEIGQRRRLFLREENVMTEPELGNILIRGKETPPEHAVSPGGMVRIEKSTTVIISFKGLPQNEIDGCQIASSTPVEIQFREDRG